MGDWQDAVAKAIGDDQQYRIDLVTPTAPVASLAKNDVLAKIFQTRPGDPNRKQPTEITFDLSPWQGQTVRLRLRVLTTKGPCAPGSTRSGSNPQLNDRRRDEPDGVAH